MIPDDAVSAPAGSVRFVNVSPASVGIIIGVRKNSFWVAGKLFQRTVPTGKESPFEVLLPDTTGALKRLHSGVILQNPGERSLVLIYSADGVGYRLPLKVTVLREPAPPASTKIPKPMKLKFCGAAGTTTGSQHLLEDQRQAHPARLRALSGLAQARLRGELLLSRTSIRRPSTWSSSPTRTSTTAATCRIYRSRASPATSTPPTPPAISARSCSPTARASRRATSSG